MADDDKTPVADHVPETPEPEKPVEKPAEPTSQPNTDTDLREAVARLEGVVSGLAVRVEQIVSHPQDERPVSTPWTHKRF